MKSNIFVIFMAFNAIYNSVIYCILINYNPSSDIIMKMITMINFYFISYIGSTYYNTDHTILSGTSLVGKKNKFYTISEAKATCYQGRTNITFAFCSLGYLILFHRMLLGDGYKSLIHCSLPIISLLPMRADIQYENVLGFKIRNSTTNILHMLAVGTYVVITTFFIKNSILFWISLLNIICLAIATNIKFRYSLELELISFEIFAVIFMLY